MIQQVCRKVTYAHDRITIVQLVGTDLNPTNHVPLAWNPAFHTESHGRENNESMNSARELTCNVVLVLSPAILWLKAFLISPLLFAVARQSFGALLIRKQPGLVALTDEP